jgi:hypothetical protein
VRPHQGRQWLFGHKGAMQCAINDAPRRRSLDGYDLNPQRPDELANGDTAAIDDYWRAIGCERTDYRRLTGQVNSQTKRKT